MDCQTNDQIWDHKKRILLEYEAGVDTYDRLYSDEQDKKYKRCSKHLDDLSGKTVLDCGCGTGTLIAQLSRQSGFFIGVDYSQAMLKLARKKNRSANNVDFVRADADNLPIKSASISQLLSFTMLGNMPKIESTLLEFSRVVRESGQIVLSFSKKNIDVDEVLRHMKEASILPCESIDDEDLKDWIVVGEKRTEGRPSSQCLCLP
jgi:ubiquinone/menaquinone biosynthesis C-methylase UbiE